jgi:hypothetical protein
MQKIRIGIVVLSLLVCSAVSSKAEVNIGIGFPRMSIGINLPLLPELTPIPGYPVYYAPRVDANYFFYDGVYWVYKDDTWYSSSWYNGPWGVVEPAVVPLFVLRIPVRYYRQPPAYFHGWQPDAPPRWSQHWGREWGQSRKGWDKWNRKSAASRAPLPEYQRHYSGERYPPAEQQHIIHGQSYKYQPRDRNVQRHLKQQGMPADTHVPQPRRGSEFAQKPAVMQPHPLQHREQNMPPGGGVRHEPQDPRLRDLEQKPQDRNDSPEQNRGRGHDR